MDGIHKSLYFLYGNERNKKAHCLIELTLSQFNRMKDNAIILGNVACPKESEYTNITYGKHVKCCRKKRSMLCNNTSDIIKLSNVKYNYVLILCKKKNCFHIFPQLSIISMATLYTNGKKEVASSGYLVLFAGCRKGSRKKSFELNWDKKDFKLLKKCKKNVIKKGNNHNESIGHYFSFGNKANFSVDEDNSSISTYKSRTTHTYFEKKELEDMAMAYDIKCAQQLQMAQNILCTIIPLNRILVMPIISAVDHCSRENDMKSPLKKNKRISLRFMGIMHLC